MKYLLDTNICIFFFRDKFNIGSILKNRGLDNCCISEITLAELRATAIQAGLTLVTDNTKDFEYLANIEIENWVER
ncbi:MAG: hypothetical protein LBN93_11630 [Candidatus Symbiothrix sp.]|jgi:predicted nucleic acid-binding protein|nr:hypothetical protein [Candidatus Symbiothrix sp.]